VRICIVSSIGEQTCQGIYLEIQPGSRDLWDLAVFDNGQPLDVVDFYQKEMGGAVRFNPDRHIYTNGILLANRLRSVTHDITVVNSLADDYPFDDTDVVIISTNYVTARWENHLINMLIKLKKKGIKCIIGGIGIKKICEKNKKRFGKIYELVDGYIIISDNGLSVMNETLNRLFFPIENKVIEIEDDYDLRYMDYSLEHIGNTLHSKHTALITQTGCVYDCMFCCYKEKYKKHTLMDINEVKKALIELNKTNIHGLSHIRFADESFNIDNSRVIDLCNFIREQKFPFRWSCFLRANNITDDLIGALSSSGCDFVSIGVESGSELLQRLMNKNIDLPKLKHEITKLRDAGIVVNISLLIGFFGETETTIQQTKDFIIESQVDLAKINLWSPAQNEKNRALFDEYAFHRVGRTWRHQTASEQDAVRYVRSLYFMDSDTAFIPPWCSIFDQWPVLSSYDLSQREILEVFRKYYRVSKMSYQQP